MESLLVSNGVELPAGEAGGFIHSDPEWDLLRSQQILAHQVADLNRNNKDVQPGKGPVVHIGFDSEFVHDDEGKVNEVLSLQFYVIGERGEFTHIEYPRGALKKDRPSLRKLVVQLILRGLEEGVILEWPRHVVVCGFFLRVDLPAFVDLSDFKHQLENIAGRAGTVREAVSIDLDDEDREKLLKTKSAIAEDWDGVRRVLKLKFIDVAGHVAPGTTLAQIGELLGLRKLTLPAGYSKDRMDLFKEGNREAFEEYGLRDAEIAVKFYLRLENFARDSLGCKSLPATASGLAVSYFKKVLADSSVDFNEALGLQQSRRTYWDARKGQLRTQDETVPLPMRAAFEQFVASCYSGGRNECYAFGPSLIGMYNDFDLAGAYTTGLVDLRHIDYDRFRTSHRPSDYVGHVLGFAYVKFAFPEGTRFPCLPVRNKDNGLVFPLTGYSHCTAPEIEVALNLGCKIEILHGIIIPWRDGDGRLFEPYVVKIRELRNSYSEGSLDELYAKLLGNSLYGKTGQGLKGKMVFDSGTLRSVELPQCAITNAAIAAHTTGFIRAVLSELIAKVPEHRSVISATTDGFITNADESELCKDGPLAMRFQKLCDRVAPGGEMLKLKHRVMQVIPFKTRGQITGLEFEDEPLILAKAGVSHDLKFEDGVEPAEVRRRQNDYMIDLFLNRKAGQPTFTHPFTSFRQQWVKDADVVRLTREKTLNIEFDFKRRLVNPRTVVVREGKHVGLDSAPWNTLEECERARALFDGWRRKRCLKTIEDFEDWEEHYQFSLSRDRLGGPGLRIGDKGLVDVMRRLFLRCYTQELCGLSRTMTYPELADWLTTMGYPTTVDEIKNARRARFVSHALPKSARLQQLSNVLVEAFPGIEIHQFFNV